LRGYWLFVDEEEAVELEEGTFFVHDILGLSVHTEEGALLGAVADVLFTGANEVYVVQGKDLPQGEVLLPAIEDVIRAVDLEAGRMTVRLLPGLLNSTEQPADNNTTQGE
jgi:16S rRNA processing protein RimM